MHLQEITVIDGQVYEIYAIDHWSEINDDPQDDSEWETGFRQLMGSANTPGKFSALFLEIRRNLAQISNLLTYELSKEENTPLPKVILEDKHRMIESTNTLLNTLETSAVPWSWTVQNITLALKP